MTDKHAITAEEFAAKYNAGELAGAYFMDVREPYEWERVRLEEAHLIPMNTVPEQMGGLDKERTMYVICAHGVRSWHVVQYLLGNGFCGVINVEGGMEEIMRYIK
ncbi:rhodanese-like domain-containing protein [Aneurinibacillus sp. REN35]|uniref:rhodanese-like domain-containing protein n=1 Tax=Aneurinibacillus sp. REN35 TaxID=3237286 RepID=UPI003526F663